MGRCFSFDDDSTCVLEGFLDKAFEIAFSDFDPERLEEAVVSAVEYFWSVRRVPDKRGDEHPWEEPYSTKADLAPAVLQPILNSQAATLLVGVDKFNLVIMDPRSGNPRTLKGAEALARANGTSLDALQEYGTKGFFLRGLGFVKQGRFGEAGESLKKAVQFDESFGEAWFWLGIALQRQGKNREARPVFVKAARLLKSPYLGKAVCPSCGWIPSGEPMWKCDGCNAELDTFETKGRCPKCQNRHATTSCIACKERPPHADWWR